MRLLHLSDIHFRSPDCENPAIDIHQPYRTLLAQDVVELCRAGGTVDAILVGGDIAFKGDPAEYRVAQAWLLDLAHQCGCPLEGIYVVPGNHDVDRSICEKSLTISHAQDAIVNAQLGDRESLVKKQLADEEVGQALFKPLSAYNDFAKYFDCNIYPSRPFWTDDVDIGGGVRLRLFGLTSTLISGLGQRDEAPGQLFLGRLQTVLNPEDNVVNLVLCHHPPSWFADADDTDDNINDRAKLQFFGHKHRQRCTPTPAYMRFQAGAVNPDLQEKEWKPGYNLLNIQVVGEGVCRSLDVRAHVRHFQKAPEMFVALQPARDQTVWTHSMPMPYLAPLASAKPGTAIQDPPYRPNVIAEAVHNVAELLEVKLEAKMYVPSTRNLVYRFWQLSIGERRDIALKLGLITDADLPVPEPERYAKALKEAAARSLLVELAQAIEHIENSR